MLANKPIEEAWHVSEQHTAALRYETNLCFERIMCVNELIAHSDRTHFISAWISHLIAGDYSFSDYKELALIAILEQQFIICNWALTSKTTTTPLSDHEERSLETTGSFRFWDWNGCGEKLTDGLQVALHTGIIIGCFVLSLTTTWHSISIALAC